MLTAKKITSLVAVLMAVTLFSSCGGCKKVQKEIVVHITSSPETEAGKHLVIMALTFADNAAKNKANVMVFFTIDGVKAALKTTSDFSVSNGDYKSKSYSELITSLKEKQVKFMVCPMCLKMAGIADDQIIEGAELGKMDTFLSTFDTNPSVLTW